MENAYSISNFYYVVAIENRDSFNSWQQKLVEVKNSEQEEWIKQMNYASLNQNSLKSAVSCIVFCSMCLEAFIFSYSERFLGKNYTKSHLDKLDLASKYLVVPKLITGKEIDKGGQPYQHLKKLIKDRNEIVHFKSKKSFGKKGKLSFLGRNSFLPISMKNAFDAVHSIMKELETIHPDEKIFFQGVVTKAECFA